MGKHYLLNFLIELINALIFFSNDFFKQHWLVSCGVLLINGWFSELYAGFSRMA